MSAAREIPNPKHQIPTKQTKQKKEKAPNGQRPVWRFLLWRFNIVWHLVLGIWVFRAAVGFPRCGPTLPLAAVRVALRRGTPLFFTRCLPTTDNSYSAGRARPHAHGARPCRARDAAPAAG